MYRCDRSPYRPAFTADAMPARTWSSALSSFQTAKNPLVQTTCLAVGSNRALSTSRSISRSVRSGLPFAQCHSTAMRLFSASSCRSARPTAAASWTAIRVTRRASSP